LWRGFGEDAGLNSLETGPKRSQNPKRPLRSNSIPHRYRMDGNALKPNLPTFAPPRPARRLLWPQSGAAILHLRGRRERAGIRRVVEPKIPPVVVIRAEVVVKRLKDERVGVRFPNVQRQVQYARASFRVGQRGALSTLVATHGGREGLRLFQSTTKMLLPIWLTWECQSVFVGGVGFETFGAKIPMDWAFACAFYKKAAVIRDSLVGLPFLKRLLHGFQRT